MLFRSMYPWIMDVFYPFHTVEETQNSVHIPNQNFIRHATVSRIQFTVFMNIDCYLKLFELEQKLSKNSALK